MLVAWWRARPLLRTVVMMVRSRGEARRGESSDVVLFFCQWFYIGSTAFLLDGAWREVFYCRFLREISVAEVARVGGFKACTPNCRTTVIYCNGIMQGHHTLGYLDVQHAQLHT